MSISELERIAMDKALAGKSVHKHNGSDYGLVTKDESEEDNRAVLIPQKDGYEPSKRNWNFSFSCITD